MGDESSGAAYDLLSINAKRFLPLKKKLLTMLEANPLDYEVPPTQQQQDMPHPMYFVPEWDPGNPDESNPTGKNSMYLLQQIKKWEMDLPDMSLLVHGGSQHPLHLIEERGLKEQREDFLRSRPRFNDTYFDGQRDPVEGWMSAANAWRNPAFCAHASAPRISMRAARPCCTIASQAPPLRLAPGA